MVKKIIIMGTMSPIRWYAEIVPDANVMVRTLKKAKSVPCRVTAMAGSMRMAVGAVIENSMMFRMKAKSSL